MCVCVCVCVHVCICMQSTKAAEEGVMNVKGLIKHGLQNIRKYVLDKSLLILNYTC